MPGLTALQVSSRVGATTAELIAEWESITPRFLAVFADPDAWALIGPRRATLLGAQIDDAGLPAIELRTHEGDCWFVGGGGADDRSPREDGVRGVVAAPRYDLWRSTPSV